VILLLFSLTPSKAWLSKQTQNLVFVSTEPNHFLNQWIWSSSLEVQYFIRICQPLSAYCCSSPQLILLNLSELQLFEIALRLLTLKHLSLPSGNVVTLSYVQFCFPHDCLSYEDTQQYVELRSLHDRMRHFDATFVNVYRGFNYWSSLLGATCNRDLRGSFRYSSVFPLKRKIIKFRIDAWQEQTSFAQTWICSGKQYTYIFSAVQQPDSALGRLVVDVSTSHTIRHTQTRYDSSERVISPSQRPLTAQHSKNTETNIHALNGIRTRDPSNRAAAELRVRPHGKSHRPVNILADQSHFSKFFSCVSLIQQH
jgi:hypothetical protein